MKVFCTNCYKTKDVKWSIWGAIKHRYNHKCMKENKDIFCPVCGYYCLGKGGHGCIDKPTMVQPTPNKKDVWEEFSEEFICTCNCGCVRDQVGLDELKEWVEARFISKSHLKEQIEGLGKEPMDETGFSENEIQNFGLGYREAKADFLKLIS